MSAPARADDKIIIGLITKDVTNPFFTKMKEGAAAKAKELGAELAFVRRQGRHRQ